MNLQHRQRTGQYTPQDKPRLSQQQGLYQEPNSKFQGQQLTASQLAYQRQMYQRQMYQQQMNSKMIGNNPYNFFRPPSPPPEPPKVEKELIDQKAKHDLTGALLPYTFKSNNNHLDYMEDDNIYIVNNIFGGGTYKYKNDIKALFPDKNLHEMQEKEHLHKVRVGVNTTLWVQQLLFTDIHPNDIIEMKMRTHCKLVISVHDFCWINYTYDNTQTEEEYHWNYLIKDMKVAEEIVEMFRLAEIIITPSWFAYNEYKKRFNGCNIVMIPHLDYKVDNTCIRVPPIQNNVINIGVLHEMNRYKGKEVISYMMDNIKTHGNYKLNYHVAGGNIPIYLETEFNEFVEKYNIHCLLMLNRWGETYCYSLSKYVNSGLPVFYNDIGAFRERVDENTEHYFKAVDNEEEYDELFSSVKDKVKPFLDYVITNQGVFNRNNLNVNIYRNSFYNLFLGDVKDYDYSEIHKKVLPFAIYFPQYHSIPENDKNYYPGMTDITNLNSYLSKKPEGEEAMTPSLERFGLSNLLEYDLTNHEIQQKQIDYAYEYGLKGFAIYYYWFSTNTITGKNTIMEKGYENFFNGKIKIPKDFKLYFIWANEDWSNNPAFNSDDLIKNEYNVEAYKKNIRNLMQYMTHESYYKIDNKPVFYLHHPWMTDAPQVKLFENMLDQACRDKGYSGSLMAVNNIVDRYGGFSDENIKKYNHNPDYKKVPGTVDYLQHLKENLYLNVGQAKVPQSIYFSFNNRPRLSIPNKLSHSTYITRATLINQRLNLQLLLSHYIKPREEENRILLLNSWNEWGENMAIEPSQEKDLSFLNMIKFALMGMMCDPSKEYDD